MPAAKPCTGEGRSPAWELEAWWFLWPDAVGSLHQTWQAPTAYVGREVGLVRNAKEELQRQLLPASSGERRRKHSYRESDAPLVARKIRELGIADEPRGVSRSYQRFQDSVRECCDHAGDR
jgi:hypothetical protein